MLIGARNAMLAGGGGSSEYWGLTFTAEQADSSISLGTGASIFIEYSLDGGRSWDSYTLGTTIPLADIGDSVCFAAADGVTNYSLYQSQFSMQGRIAATGDISSLLRNDSATASGLTLGYNCYERLFSGCTSLTHAPDLPAMSLSSRCYYAMFSNCTALTEAPALPATELLSRCYANMFSSCEGLIYGPELPASTLANDCYNQMFVFCQALRTVKVAFNDWSPGSATRNWFVEASETGTFICPAALGTNETITRGTSNCPSGWTVVNT